MNPTSPRPAKRSRKGCAECKSRRIKCDEKRPQCGQCLRHRRACTILDSLFRVDARSSSRQQPRRSSTPIVNETTPAEHPSAATWASNGTYHATLQAQSSPIAANAVAPSPSAQVVSPTFATATRVPPTPGVTSAPTPSQYVSPGQTSTISELSQDEEEIAFFSRIFNENAAQWLDLLNNSQCFTEVAALAFSAERSHPLCRMCEKPHSSSMKKTTMLIAVAAKQLGQTTGSESEDRQSRGQILTAKTLLAGDRDSNWYGAKYYEKAIQLLARQLSHGSPSWSSHPSPSLLYDLDPETGEESPTIALMVDCMLSLYEMLSATVSMSAWGGHLNGLHKLFQHLGNGALFTAQSMVLNFPLNELTSIQASFWWFAISDAEQSFATGKCTRVDVSNLTLWRNMGVSVDDNGTLIEPAFGNHQTLPILDDARARAIIRAVCGVVNMISPYPMSNQDPSGESAAHITGRINLPEYLAAIPSLPQPDYHWIPAPPEPSLTHELFGQEVWYSCPLIAVAAALHHMAQILLLVNAPITTDIRNQRELLRASHLLQAKLRHHAAEVFAIALGKQKDPVRLHLLQPLFVAGQCLTEREDRIFLIKLIRALETDLGLMSEYRVSDLITEWATTYEDLGLCPKEVSGRKDFWG